MLIRSFCIVRTSLRTLLRFPLRSALILMSASLGVAGAVASVNFALGGREKVTRQLARMGTNILIVSPAQSRAVAGRARTGALVTTLTEDDYATVRREIPTLSRSSAFSNLNLPVKVGDLARNNSRVIGIEPDYMAIKEWKVDDGELFGASDVRGSRRVAVLGSKIARELFGNASPVGGRLWINRVPFEVAAVMTERGQSLDAANEDDQIYIPLSTAMRRIANVNYYSGILVTVDRWDNMEQAAGEIRKLLRRRHRSIGKLPQDFQVLNRKQLMDTQLAASDQLMFFARWIGFSALIVSGLGVLAISWIAVRERTREIGTRRALGAARGDVFLQVLSEAATLAVGGSGLGVALALECSTLLARWAAQPLVLDRRSAWLAACVSMTLNVMFAALPAGIAAKLNPIEALRFE
jgi:putative ABC transport system permease protein